MLGSRVVTTTAFLLVLAAGPAGATDAPREAPIPSSIAAKLDPRLDAARSGTDPIAIWVRFGDKGERGPSELAARLAQARASLTERSRARRLRNHVWPLVDYRDLPVEPSYLEALRAQGFEPIGVSRWFNQVALRVGGERLAELASLPCVERIEPTARLHRSPGPELLPAPVVVAPPATNALCSGVDCAALVDHGQTQQQLDQIHVAALHDSGYTGAGVMVAVLDDGFNYHDKHEALRDQTVPLLYERDFVRGRYGAQDTLSVGGGLRHGTQCFGLVGGKKPGTYLGSAYGATFILARTENDFSETAQEEINWGLGAEWADSLGADIITSSLGYSQFDGGVGNYTYAQMDGRTTLVSRAAEIAASKGILVVNAVGNEGGSAWKYLIAPSDVNGDSVLAIGAVNLDGTVTGFSSYGPSADGRVKPDVCALGSLNPLILPSGPPNVYTSASGTSFATPLVAGAAACIMQARPTWTARDVARALKASASQSPSPDVRKGYGIIDARKALDFDAVAGVIPTHVSAGLLQLLGPNPARSATGVRVRMLPGGTASGSPGVLRVLDAQGRKVATLWSGTLCDQALSLAWDGRDGNGRPVAAGLYFVQLSAPGARSTLRIALLR